MKHMEIINIPNRKRKALCIVENNNYTPVAYFLNESLKNDFILALQNYHYNDRISVFRDFLPADHINIPILCKTLKNGFYGLVRGKLCYIDNQFISIILKNDVQYIFNTRDNTRFFLQDYNKTWFLNKEDYHG